MKKLRMHSQNGNAEIRERLMDYIIFPLVSRDAMNSIQLKVVETDSILWCMYTGNGASTSVVGLL